VLEFDEVNYPPDGYLKSLYTTFPLDKMSIMRLERFELLNILENNNVDFEFHMGAIIKNIVFVLVAFMFLNSLGRELLSYKIKEFLDDTRTRYKRNQCQITSQPQSSERKLVTEQVKSYVLDFTGADSKLFS